MMKKSKKHNLLTAADLAKLVPLARQGDALAITALCNAFTPLIMHLSHRSVVYKVFGEDAENTVWVLFLEFICNYEGENYRHLPGLVRKFLIFKLVRMMSREGYHWDTHATAFTDELESVPAAEDALQETVLHIALCQELAQLSPKQQLTLQQLYFKELPQEVAARNLHCSERNVRKLKKISLYKLRKQLLQCA